MLGSKFHATNATEILSLPFASNAILHSLAQEKVRSAIRTSWLRPAKEANLAVSWHGSRRFMMADFTHLASSQRTQRNMTRSEVCQMDPSEKFLRIQVSDSKAEVYVKLATANANAVMRFSQNEEKQGLRWTQDIQMALYLGISNAVSFAGAAYATSNGTPAVVYDALSAGLDFSVQFLYLGSLLALLGIGSFLVVRQILVRRELETAAKDLQERVRTGQASPLEYFELGAVMLRKKFFPLATRYLEQAIQKWDGDDQDLAQVYNALGFTYANAGKFDKAIAQYEKSVKLQPGYVVAWNNLGDAYEKKKDLPAAVKAYEQVLLLDPNNRVAKTCCDIIKERVERLKGVPASFD